MELLTLDKPGFECLLLGNEAVVRGAIEAGVQFASCYPGTPSSEIGDTFARLQRTGTYKIQFEYSINEKVAVEIAFGASLAGARAIVSMKHLGLNYAGDPSSTIPYVGTVGGLVIVAAGDPSLHTSPNEQDHRHFARMLHIPTLDPSTPQDALEMTRFAFELSEKTQLPVLIRITTRVCHVRGIVKFGEIKSRPAPAGFQRDVKRFMPTPVHSRRLRLEVKARLEKAQALLSTARFDYYYHNECGSSRWLHSQVRDFVVNNISTTSGAITDSSHTDTDIEVTSGRDTEAYPLGSRQVASKDKMRPGIIATGAAFVYAADIFNELNLGNLAFLLKIGAPHPIDENLIADFIRSADRILVIEELTPFLEDTLHAIANRIGCNKEIIGKRSGHLPDCYEYSPDIVRPVIREFLRLPEESPIETAPPFDALPARPPVLCPGCPHRATFYLIKRVFGKKTLYFSDIGCYTLGYNPPLEVGDALLCMGAGITKAAGVSRVTGERTVAVIGDSTFFHSGLPGILDVVQSRDNVLIVILDNKVTGMTGFQPSLSSDKDWLGRKTPDIRIDDICRSLGVSEVQTIDPFDVKASLEVLRQLRASQNPGVVISASPCPMYETRATGQRTRRGRFFIDRDECTGCYACINTLGCPAFFITDDGACIDDLLCSGCGLCPQVCPHDAIRQISSNGNPAPRSKG